MKQFAEKIQLVKDLKRFAVEELGIVDNPSFGEVVKADTFYVVYASHKGRVASPLKRGYEFFRDRNEFRKRKKQLEDEGYDIVWRKWEACSLEDCPITPSILRSSKTRIGNVVLHENFHIHSKKHDLGLEFDVEEAVCQVFAWQGSLIYFGERNRLVLPHVEEDIEKTLVLYDFINEYLAKLGEAYQRSFGDGRAVLDQARDELKSMVDEGIVLRRTHKKFPVNNAYFLMYQDYAAKIRPVFEALWGEDIRAYVGDPKRLCRLLEGI